VKTPRRASSPTKASETKRLEKKKIHGAIKKLRQDTGFEEE
jgi:hypothetical protein